MGRVETKIRELSVKTIRGQTGLAQGQTGGWRNSLRGSSLLPIRAIAVTPLVRKTMNATIAIESAPAVRSTTAGTLPGYCYLLVFGATCIPLGVLWDISWHSTIGRDTFWTPAHMLTYLGGLVPALTFGWLAVQ